MQYQTEKALRSDFARGAPRCPPGHGDIYPSLLGSGMLERLVRAGIEYLFVSNSDNLGATLDVDLLAYFAESGKAFLMEARHARARAAAAAAGRSASQVAWAPRSFAAGHLRLRVRTSLGVPGD